jgi:hypothetical protein
MSDPLNAFRNRHDRITISTIHVAFALSLLLHALLLSGWLPKVKMSPSEHIGEGKPSGSLAVRILPPPAPPPAPPAAPMALAPPARGGSAARVARPPARQRVLAQDRPAPAQTAPPPAESASAPASTDLAAFIEARRRARAPEAAQPPSPARPPVETAQERDNRIAAMNLGLNRTPSFGDERRRGGGIFQVARKGYDDAEFFFFGWNKAIRRNSRQMIEVRRGDNPSIEIAIVRKMIAIIREHEQSDFVWESHRLGRDVWLSARASDNAGLEDFLMQEFFPGYGRAGR